MRKPASIALLPVALALSACVRSETDAVRALAVSRFHCDAADVTVRKLRSPDAENTVYQASACGYVERYKCNRSMTTTGRPGLGGATTADRPTTVCDAESE